MTSIIPNQCTSIDIGTKETDGLQSYNHKDSYKIPFLGNQAEKQFTDQGNCKAEQNQNTGGKSSTTSDNNNTIRKKIWKACSTNIRVTHIYYAAATTTFIALLFYFIKSQTTSLSEEKNIDIRQSFNAMHLNGLSVGGQLVVSLKDWDFLENLNSDGNSIQFTVKQDMHLNPKYITAVVENGALKISGRPNFCFASGYGTPEKMTFSNISYVHLNDMDNCHNYANLILTKWNFPQVKEIRLEKMILQKKEFRGLTQFIDRHNNTLHKVEIDDCYICESPDCEAGMIDFPNHDFKLKITRRRKSPNWF